MQVQRQARVQMAQRKEEALKEPVVQSRLWERERRQLMVLQAGQMRGSFPLVNGEFSDGPGRSGPGRTADPWHQERGRGERSGTCQKCTF